MHRSLWLNTASVKFVFSFKKFIFSSQISDVSRYCCSDIYELCCIHPYLDLEIAITITNYYVPVSDVPGRRHLRSASRHQLTVPRVRCSTFGCRSFASAGPTVWNSLPNSLRNPAVGPEQFRRTLKTHLFACCC